MLKKDKEELNQVLLGNYKLKGANFLFEKEQEKNKKLKLIQERIK